MPITRRPLGLLVDLDDTIVTDSVRASEHWEAAVTSTIVDRGIDDRAAAGRLLDAIHAQRAWYWSDPERHRIGRSDLIAARRVIVSAAAEEARLADTGVVEQIVQAYTRRTDADRKLLPGAVDALERLREIGVRLAMVTNGAELAQREKIERFDLERHFEVIVIEGAFGAGKPDPSVYVHALRGLAVAADDAWMVGDHLEWDVAAPQRLGVAGVWLDMTGDGLPDGAVGSPDLIVPDLPALTAAIERLGQGRRTRTAGGTRRGGMGRHSRHGG